MTVRIGWNSEAFARTKILQDVSEYLKPPLDPAEEREKGATAVAQMLERMARRSVNQESSQP